MPFKKSHTVGFVSTRPEPLDKTPICFKGRQGQREKLMSVPNWQDRLREFVESLIQEESSSE